MQNIFITCRHKNDMFDTMLHPSMRNINTKMVITEDKPDRNVTEQISYKYNEGIKTAINAQLITDNTVVIFCKPSVSVADPNFVNKLHYTFEQYPNLGIVGVKGVKVLTNNSELYSQPNLPINGIVYNVKDINSGEYDGTITKGFYMDVIAVDDSVFAIRGKVLLSMANFFKINTNVGFGIEATLNVLNAGYTSSVADIFAISNEYTNISSVGIDNIVNQLNLEYPLSVDRLNITKNFIIDVEL